MTPNPYKRPDAHVEDRPPPRSFSWWACWAGAAAATGTGFMLVSAASPLLQHWYAARAPDLQTALQVMFAATEHSLLLLALNAFGSAVGGYLAAHLAPERPLLHAAAAAILVMALGASSYLGVFPMPYPVWVQLAGFVVTIPSFLYGGLKAQRRAAARSER